MPNETKRSPLDLPRVAQTLDFTCGAACFASMMHYFRGVAVDDLQFAKELGALELGYTPPINIANLARNYGFSAELVEGASFSQLSDGVEKGEVVFVTWWDEDAGHYSLVKQLDADHILLMDPWLAREGLDNRLLVGDFETLWQARGSKLIRVWLSSDRVTEPAASRPLSS